MISSILLKFPFSFLYFIIALALDSPIPFSDVSSSSDAVLMFTFVFKLLFSFLILFSIHALFTSSHIQGAVTSTLSSLLASSISLLL